MKVSDLANSWVCDLHTYIPGKPIEETARELGLDAKDIIKLASNENPLGPSPLAVEAMQQAIQNSHIYPDGAGFRLRQALADRFSLKPENIVLGNGSNEIIEFLCHAFLKPGAELLTSTHTFSVYRIMGAAYGAKVVEIPTKNLHYDLAAIARAITPATRLIFITNPNNPTGTLLSQEEIDDFMAQVPDHVVVCFDEAYFEFADFAPDTLKFLHAGRKVCILRTCSKIYGLAALRIGYGLATEPIAELLQKVRQPFNVNQIAQEAALAALVDEEHLKRSLRTNREGLDFWYQALDKRKLPYIASHANFVLFQVGQGSELFQAMLKRGVIIRAMDSYGLPDWVRITIGNQAQNERALQVLDETLKERHRK